MKILYVGSNPENGDNLRLEVEITLFQRKLIKSGMAVDIIFLPHLTIEQFQMEVSSHKPDILHISAHAGMENLALTNSEGTPIPLSGKQLAGLLDYDSPPKLIYLSACNSDEIAKEVAKYIPVAIGINAPITVEVARNAALIFYEKLFQGETVKRAFEASNKFTEIAHSNKVSTVLHSQDNSTIFNRILFQPPSVLSHN